MSDEQKREHARTALEDAVWQAMEAGFSADDVREEVDNAITEKEADSG